MSKDEEKGSSFKFKDNRRFDNEGNDRSAEVESPKDEAPVQPAKSAPQPVTPVTPSVPSEDAISPELDPTEGEDEINFSSFVVSLATQALMQLGQMKAPPGVQMPLDKEGARQTIAILSMLEKKTQSNLTPEERRLMDEVMHSLRLSFLKAV